MITVNRVISTSDHMLGRAIWDKLPVHFWKFWNCLSKTRAISKCSKITRVIHPKNCPNRTYDYWLITPSQQTLGIKTDISISGIWLLEIANHLQKSGQVQNASSYKITPLREQCRMQSIVWLIVKLYLCLV